MDVNLANAEGVGEPLLVVGIILLLGLLEVILESRQHFGDVRLLACYVPTVVHEEGISPQQHCFLPLSSFQHAQHFLFVGLPQDRMVVREQLPF